MQQFNQPNGQFQQGQEGFDEQMVSTYKGRLVGMWLELSDLSSEFQKVCLRGRHDANNDIKYDYFTALRALWMELKPHVDQDNEGDAVIDDSDEEEFNAFERYAKNPELLDLPDNADDIYKMHAIIGRILRKLSVTDLK
jgi:hypothetical protein